MIKALQEKLLQLRRDAEERDAQRRAQKLGLEYVDLRKAPFELESLKVMSEADSLAAKAIPLQLKGNELLLAVYDSKLPETQAAIKKLQSESFILKIVIGSISGLEHLRSSYKFAATAPPPQITGVVTIDRPTYDAFSKKLKNIAGVQEELASFDPKTFKTPEVLDAVLLGAMFNHASDIHFEPEEHAVRLRYRIDGVLQDIAVNFSKDIYHALNSRIKLLAKLKLNVTTVPQDGRFTVALPEKETEIRVSIIPSEYGETIVMRVLFAEALELSISDLGFRPDDLRIVEEELKKPEGMILNTGPTGSGKTTTLYVFLKTKKTPEIKIITIENPIEYHLPGIEQTQVDQGAGYDFPTALKSILRQDPDVILVGEINDKETAEIGVQAALTGHTVFSTVHANNAPAAVPRLIDLGVKTSSIGPALNLIIAQRLVRRLCENCKTAAEVTAELKKNLDKFIAGLPARAKISATKSLFLFSPKGCEKCSMTGYKGRVGIFELFKVDDEADAVLHKDASEANLQKLAKSQGMTTVQQDGILKAMSGITSLEEVESATGPLKL